MSFQKIVLIIAIILLIVILTFIGLFLDKTKNKEKWPPIIGNCPDYWTDLSGNGEACLNVKKLGNCNLPTKSNPNTMNFNENPFLGENGNCSKYRWAKNCQVTWDGITSGVKNPCSTTSSNK